MKRRTGSWSVFACVFGGTILVTTVALAQFATPNGKYAGTAGASCAGLGQQYAWPDANGQILQCVSNVWMLVNQTAAAAGSTGQVQFNNSGSLAGNANFIWDNADAWLGIGGSPITKLGLYGSDTTVYAPISTVQPGSSGPTTLEIINGSNVTGSGAYLVMDATTGGINDIGYIGMISTASSTTPAIVFGQRSGSSYFETMRIDSTGNVGIGTTSPAFTFEAVDNLGVGSGEQTIAALGRFSDNAGSTGAGIKMGYFANGSATTGGFIRSTFTQPLFVGTQSHDQALTILDSNGSIGIGTTNPMSELQVYGGEVQIGSSGASCATANNGALRYSSGTVYVCFGTTWTAVGSSGGGSSINFGTGVSATSGTNYLASSAGIVVAFGSRSSGSCVLTGKSDGTSTPTTVVAEATSVATTGDFISITYPVISGNHYSVTQSGCTGYSGLFYPLTGSGGGGGGTVTSSIAGQVAYFQSTGTTVIGTSTMNIVNNNVGIGSATPIVPLNIEGSLSSATASSVQYFSAADGANLVIYPAALSQVTATKMTTAFGNIAGSMSWVDSPASNSNTVGFTLGLEGLATTESTIASNYGSAGVDGEAYLTGTIDQTDGNLVGVQGIAENDTGGTNAGGMAGGFFDSTITAGTVTNGIDSIDAYSGSTGGTVTNGLGGIYVEPDIDGGTVDWRYGIFLAQGDGTPSGGAGSDFGIYQESTSAVNYFGGAIGIGTGLPLQVLDVRAGNYAGNQNIGIQLGVPGGQWFSRFSMKSDSVGDVRTAIDATDGTFHGTTNEAISISANGSVSIGTTVPFGTFHVRAGTNNNMVFSNSTDMGTPTMLGIVLNDANNDIEPLELIASAFNLTGGNVGIDITSPGNALTVGATAVSGPTIAANNTQDPFQIAFTNTLGFVIGGGSASPFPVWLQVYDTGTSGLTFPLALNPLGGGVGIGTTDMFNQLTVLTDLPGDSDGIWVQNTDATGQSEIDLSTSNIGAVFYIGVDSTTNNAYLGNSSNSTMEFDTDSTSRMVITGGGNVGIGTTIPFGTFHVRAGTDNNMVFANDTDMGTPTMLGIVLNDADNDIEPLELVASAFNLTGGNVGIGITSPTATLHVAQTNVSPSFTTAAGTAAIFQSNLGNSSAFTTVSILAGASGNSFLEFGSPTAQDLGYIYYSNAANRLTLGTPSGDTLSVVGGNVGIGTTSPNVPLYVYTPTTGSGTAAVETLRNGSATCILKPGTGSMTTSCSSDARLKKDIVDTGDELSWLNDMRVRDYTVRVDNSRMTGVIAQELLPTHPNMVHMGADGFYTVDDPNPWKLVKAVQELKAENDNLRAANDNEAAQIKKLTARLDALERIRH